MTEPAAAASNVSDSVVATQELLTHMQHELQQMHDVALSQQKQIDELTRAIFRLEQRIDDAGNASDLPSPLDEKPPHY